jgi:hypothetical protein
MTIEESAMPQPADPSVLDHPRLCFLKGKPGYE